MKFPNLFNRLLPLLIGVLLVACQGQASPTVTPVVSAPPTTAANVAATSAPVNTPPPSPPTIDPTFIASQPPTSTSLPTATPMPASTSGANANRFKGIEQGYNLNGFFYLGSRYSRLAVTDYTDFLCIACRPFVVDVQSQVIEKYVLPGQVRIAYRPLLTSGDKSLLVAEAAFCAAKGAYGWHMYELLFQNQAELIATSVEKLPDVLKGYTKGFKDFDQPAFNKCLDSRETRKTIQDIDKTHREKGITVPTYEIGTQKFTSVQPLDTYTKAIDEALKTSGRSVNPPTVVRP